jgi:hypothetical protein
VRRFYTLIDGVRESAQSWKELLLDLKRRGLAMGPELAVADGALGFWQAVEEVWPRTRGPAYWVFRFYDRFRGRAEREISLGPETALSLDKARAIADGLRAQIAGGYLPNCRVAGAMRRRSIEAGSKDKTNVEGLKVRGFLK